MTPGLDFLAIARLARPTDGTGVTGLARLFEDGGHSVLGSVGDANQLLDLVDRERPDPVVIDVRMPPDLHRRRGD